jgi:hypothetical protein
MDRSHVKDILNKRLEEYLLEAASDLKLTETNIKDKSLQRSALGAKWCRYAFEENQYNKLLKNNIEKLKEEIIKKLFEKRNLAVENADPNVKRIINIDAEKVLVKTPEYKKYKEELDIQEEILRAIEETQRLIGQFGYDIKNAIEVMKLEFI